MTNFKQKLKSVLFATFFAFGVAQCGGKDSNSSKVKFRVLPDNPVVVDATLTINPGLDDERIIQAPWFLMSASITNNSDKTLYIVTVKNKVIGNDNGAQVTTEGSLEPGTACSADPNTRVYIAILSPGQIYEGVTNSCDPTSATDQGSAPNGYESWFIHSLPDIDPPVYSVEFEGAGWFVDAQDVPVERLTMTGYLSTQ